MVHYKMLLRHLTQVAPQHFGVLCQQNTPTAEMLQKDFPFRMKCLFSPEHGWYGFAGPGEKTAHDFHPQWLIPIHSLYGEHRKPTPAMFKGIQRVVVDLQDLGVRCYTYLATLKYMLEACAENHIAVTVLDRPIPLGGVVDGPMREIAFTSFVAPLNIPLCHGMTPGECATYIKREECLDLDLTVIKMKDWSHADRAPWTNFVPPSPGIRNWDTAALYPATVFTEAFPSIDCDRQGALAFRVLGAPWLDAKRIIADTAGALPSCGMGARLIKYKPQGGPYVGQVLDGILLSIENPDAYYPVTGGSMVFALIWQRHRTEFTEGANLQWLDKLSGSHEFVESLHGDAFNKLLQQWIDELEVYIPKRVNLYGE